MTRMPWSTRSAAPSRLVDITPDRRWLLRGDGAPRRRGSRALRRGNFMARARMIVLYDHSVTWNGLVIGTGNKTETLLGYTTLYGDNAFAFNPIGDLYKSQVRQLSEAMGVPDAILRKAPSADLWPGQTDENEVGFSYAEIDRILYWLVDRRRTNDELVAHGLRAPTWSSASKGWSRARSSSARCRRSPSWGRGRAGIDYLYPRRRPGSTACLSRPCQRGPGTLYVVATPIGNLGDITLRSLDVLRAVPLVAAEDTRMTRRLLARHGIETPLISYHAQSGDARRDALIERLAGGEDVAHGHGRGHAARQRSRRRARRAWAARGGRSCRSPARPRCSPRWSRAACPAPAGRSKGFCPGAARAPRADRAHRRPTTAATVLFESPGRTGRDAARPRRRPAARIGRRRCVAS